MLASKVVFFPRFLGTRPEALSPRGALRRILATFAYGPDIVSYKRTTSSAAELPEVSKDLVARRREACERLRVEVERGIGEANLGVPVREGHLRHPNDPRQAE